MALNAKTKEYTGGNNNSKRVEQPHLEAGTYPARIVQVIDLGVQEQQPYKGEPKPPAQEIMVTYEFVDEFIIDEEGNPVEDKPRWLSESFALKNLQVDLATSTKRYYAADPEVVHEGDWTQLIGAPVMVTVTVTPGKGKNVGKTFNNIATTSAMRKKEADKIPELRNAGKIFDQSDISTVDILLTLPEWLQTKVKGGLEFAGSPMEKALKTAGAGKSEREKSEKPRGENHVTEAVEGEEGKELEDW